MTRSPRSPHADPALARRWRNAVAVAATADVVAFVLLRAAGVPLEFAQAGAFALALAAALVAMRGVAFPRPLATLGVVVALAFAAARGRALAARGARPPAGRHRARGARRRADVLLLGLAAFAGSAPAGDRGVAALLAIAYLLVLRLVYLGQVELMPQEAYYWNYAQHLDIGYLDHPPLVAWLVAASLALGGGEFFVRLPAVLACGRDDRLRRRVRARPRRAGTMRCAARCLRRRCRSSS